MKNIKEPCDSELVDVKQYIKDVEVELKYSTTDNFTGKVIYSFSKAFLRYGTVKKMSVAQSALKEKGYRLKIWDAFRPVEAQFVLWEVYPDDDFVADPTKGFSNHSRGNTVDVTLVDGLGNEIEMPTGFDRFEDMAKYDYKAEENKESAQNSLLLSRVMKKCGFKQSSSEWWHFVDDEPYPVEKEFSLL